MSVKSSDNVFEVLDYLTRVTSPVSGTEIATALQIPVTSMARALATLESAGYVRRTNSQPRFELGSAGQMLVYAYMSQFPVRNAALPYLQQLTSTSGHSCALFQRVGNYAVRIAFIAGSGAIINLSPLGEARGLGDGAAGLIFKAFMESPHGNAPQEGDAAIRRQGYARAPSLHELGGQDVAFPLFAPGWNEPQAVVMLEGVAVETSQAIIDDWRGMIDPLQAAIRRDSSLLYSPYAHLSPVEIDLEACRTVHRGVSGLQESRLTGGDTPPGTESP